MIDLTIHCCICTAVIEEKRSRRNTATCSEKCKNKLDSIRAEQRRSKKCPHCLAPSSPEEREEFRKWRVNRGTKDGGRLNVRSEAVQERDRSLPPKRDMFFALKHAAKEVEKLSAIAADFSKVTLEEAGKALVALRIQGGKMKEYVDTLERQRLNYSRTKPTSTGTTQEEQGNESVAASDRTTTGCGELSGSDSPERASAGDAGIAGYSDGCEQH